MANALQELVLRIGGDSSGGQQATRDLANALANTLNKALQDTGQKAEESSHKVSGFQRYIEELKPSTDNAHASFTSLHKTLTEMWENPTAGVKNLAGAIGTDLSGALASAGGSLGTTALVVGGVASVFAVAGAAAFELSEKAASTGAMLQDLSVKTGIAVGPLSVLSKAAKVAGTDINTLANAVFMMEKNMGENPDKFEKGLERIGLHFAEFKKLAPEEQLTAIAAGLKATADPVERNAAGFELMGRQFRDLAPTLAKLNDALALTADLKPWTEEQARLGEQYEMHMASIRLHLESIINGVGKQLLPYFERLSEILDQMSRWAPGGAMSTLLKIAGGPVGFVTGVAGPLERAYGSAALSLAAPGGISAPGVFGLPAISGIGGLSLPASPNSPYAQGAKLPTLENDSRVVGATNEEMFKIFDELEKEQFRKSEEAHKKYVQDWQRTEDEIQKIWAEAAVAGAAIDTKSIAGQLAILEQKRINEENAAATRIAETTKSEDLLEQQVAAIREKYRLLEDAAIQSATEKNIEESEAAGLAAAAAVSKMIAGPQTVLKDMVRSVPISLHSLLTPLQEMGQVITDVTVTAKEHFDRVHDGITDDITDIVTRMREQGVQTRDDLQRTADTFKAEYTAMAASGKFTTEELIQAWQRYREAVTAANSEVVLAYEKTARFAGGLNAINSALGPIANLSPMFTLVHNAINGVTSGLEAAARASADMAEHGMNASNLSSIAAGYIGIGVAVYQMTANFIDARRAANALEDSLVFAKDVGKDFGIGQFTPALSKELEDLTTTIAGLFGLSGRNYGEALKLSAIIEELGGFSRLTAEQLKQVKDRVGDLFTEIAKGGRLGVLATEELDKVLGEMSTHLDAYGQVDQFFTDMVEKARQAGIVLPSVVAFFTKQASDAAAGLSDLLEQPMIASGAAVKKSVDEAQKAYDDLKASGKATAKELTAAQDKLTAALAVQHGEAVRNKQSLDDLGQDAVTAFNVAIASGQDFVTALQSIAPQLATIQQAYKDLGLEIDDTTLKGLTLENTILNGTADAPSGLGKAIGGLNALITAAMNLGHAVETPAAAAAQQRTLTGLYSQAQGASANAGTTGDAGTAAALEPFQRTLHQLQEWASKNNVDLDENTRQMIDQSKELGIWNDDFKTDSEKTRQSIADLIKSQDHLAEIFGHIAASAPPGTPTASGSAPTSGYWNPAGNTPSTWPPPEVQFATEAYVRRPTMAMVGDVAGGEFVLKPSTVKQWMSESYLKGATATSDGQSVVVRLEANFNIKTYDSQDMQRAVRDEIGPRFVELVGDGKFVNDLRRALDR